MFQPWKLAMLSIGLALLLFGSANYQIIDWDFNISIIMALLTYVTAPQVIACITNGRNLVAAMAMSWFSIDGCYWIYWSVVNPDALFLRAANAACSTPVYLLLGIVWSYEGSLKSLRISILDAFHCPLKPPD